MSSRHFVWTVLLCAAIVLVAGCRTAPLQQSAISRAVVPEGRLAADNARPEDLIEAHAHYGAGIIHDLDDEPDLAMREYYEAARKDPSNEMLVLEVTSRLLRADQPEQALELLRRATARADASAAIHARLGLVLSRLGAFESAVKANRNAIRQEPRSLVGYRNLYVIYQQNKEEKKALGVLDEAAGVLRTDAEFLIGLAELYANLGFQVRSQKPVAHVRALAVLQRAERCGPDDPELRMRMADGYNLLGKEDEAARIYMDLLAHPANLPELRENIRAKLLDLSLRARDPKLTVEQLQAVIRDNPTDVEAYYLLGCAAYEEGKYQEAEDHFAKALLLRPGFEPAYYDLAGAQIGANKDREALETLDEARARFRQTFPLEYLSGVACSRLKDYSNAISHFSTAEIVAIATDTNRLTDIFYFQFGAACERKGDYAQAEKYLEECLRRSPNFATAQNYLGYMWADRGEKLDEARRLIEKAVTAEPGNAAYLDSMGWVLFKLRHPQEALDSLLKAIKLSGSEDPSIYDHLGDVYSALGQMENAHAAWSKSLSIESNDEVRKKLAPAAR